MSREDADVEFLPFVLPGNAHGTFESTRLHLGVTPLGENRFRVEEPVYLSHINFGDVIEAELRDDGNHHWVRTVEEADVRDYSLPGVALEELEREDVASLLEEICDVGGQWETPVSGCLYIQVPAESPLPDDWKRRWYRVLIQLRSERCRDAE